MTAERLFNWYWFWDYSGGLLVGEAAHVISAIHWLMISTYPLAVTAAGILPPTHPKVTSLPPDEY